MPIPTLRKTTLWQEINGLVVIVLIVGLITGIILLQKTKFFGLLAAINSATREVESSNLTSGANIGQDSAASGGQYVELIPMSTGSVPPTLVPPSPTPYPFPSSTPPPSSGAIQFISSSAAQSAKLAGSVTIPRPSSYQVGDLLVATVQSDYAGGIGTLAGWTLINNDTVGQSYDLTTRAFYKIAGSSEPSSYLWSLTNPDLDPTNGGGAIIGATISVFRGVNTSNPIYSWATNPETSGQYAQTCPTVDSPAGGMLVCQFTHDDPPRICVNTNGDCIGVAASTGLTEINFWKIPVDPNHGFDDSHETSYQLRQTSGQTGTKTAYLKNSTKDGNDHTLAFVLRPSSIQNNPPTPTNTPIPPSPTPPGLQSTPPAGTTSCSKTIGPTDNVSSSISSLNPGDTLCLRAGIYHQSVTVNKSGTPSARIAITNYATDSVIFEGGAFTVADTSSFLDISGFTIRGSTNYYAFGHFGEDNRISHVTITGNQDAALLVRSSHRSEFSNLTVTENAKAWGYSATGCNPGVSGGWPSAVSVKESSYITIRNSNVGRNCGEGMNAWDKSDHITFSGNIVHDNWSVEMYMDHTSDTTFEGNLIYDTENTNPGNKNMPHGISIADESTRGWSTCTTRNNTIRNNIVVNTKTGVSNFNYLSCAGLDNTKIENNTFVNQWEQGIRVLGSNNAGSFIRNNIIYPRPGASALQITNPSGINLSNNLVSIDPQLHNINGCTASSCPAANFILTAGSPAINTGTNSTTAPTDYFGKTRTGIFDIGAHEF